MNDKVTGNMYSGQPLWQKLLTLAALIVVIWFAWTQFKSFVETRDQQIVEQTTKAVLEAQQANEAQVKDVDSVTDSRILYIPASNEACGYDFDYMPEGKDEFGIPKSDYGIKVDGNIKGPAIVQLDSMSIVAVYPGQTFDVPKGATVWVYTGGESCPRSQFGEFPGKTVYSVDMVSTGN
jgi:hypothetical protein